MVQVMPLDLLRSTISHKLCCFEREAWTGFVAQYDTSAVASLQKTMAVYCKTECKLHNTVRRRLFSDLANCGTGVASDIYLAASTQPGCFYSGIDSLQQLGET